LDTTLVELGWTAELEAAFLPWQGELVPGRIAVESHGLYGAYTTAGGVWAEITGRMRHDAQDRSDLPAVGDWVALQPRPGANEALIRRVLPRKSVFVRKEAGFRTQGQVLAANVDLVWILGSLTRELSARRIERYLAVAWESGARPVIVLTKADLDEADAERVREVEAIAFGAPVIRTSAVTGEGVDELRTMLQPNLTAAVLGVSGVGKSTLVNTLLGEDRMATHETDALDVGRHTTSHRELVRVPSGGFVVDTPGLRELTPWDGHVDSGFGDVAKLAQHCRFNDCSHRLEPGCAVQSAIATGAIDEARLATYRKMQREHAYVERRKRGKAAVNTKRRFKDISKRGRELGRERG
jgi:ribosome biogenesis GTPase